jgi:hypothetical protein
MAFLKSMDEIAFGEGVIEVDRASQPEGFVTSNKAIQVEAARYPQRDHDRHKYQAFEPGAISH